MAMSIFSDPLLAIAVTAAGLAAVALGWYLVRRPPTTRATKLILFAGIGALPLVTAGSGNLAGYQATKARAFCASCHVMQPYGADAADPDSGSLASRHSRNAAFGAESCYACHADYGMFGTVATKLGGLRHVYEYVRNYRAMPVDAFLETIHIRAPFPNGTCIHCHSTETPAWLVIGDHASALVQVRAGALSCASEGCHGAAHPFSKAARRRAAARAAAPPPRGAGGAP
jgi:cytochrome c-type protein NapC